jgi:hypothetical protein
LDPRPPPQGLIRLSHVAAGLGGLIVAAVGLLLPILLVRFLYLEKIFI